jgi:hypothetical protein
MSKSSKLISNLSSLKDSPFHLSTSDSLNKQIFFLNVLKKKEYPKGIFIKGDDYTFYKRAIDNILDAILEKYLRFDTDINTSILNEFNRVALLDTNDILKQWKIVIRNYINILEIRANELITEFNTGERSAINNERIIKITLKGKQQEIKIQELYILLINLLNFGFSNIYDTEEKARTNKMSAYTNMNIIYKHFYYKLKNNEDDQEKQIEKISKLLKYILARLVIDKIKKGETDKEMQETNRKIILDILKNSSSIPFDMAEKIINEHITTSSVYYTGRTIRKKF